MFCFKLTLIFENYERLHYIVFIDVNHKSNHLTENIYYNAGWKHLTFFFKIYNIKIIFKKIMKISHVTIHVTKYIFKYFLSVSGRIRFALWESKIPKSSEIGYWNRRTESFDRLKSLWPAIILSIFLTLTFEANLLASCEKKRIGTSDEILMLIYSRVKLLCVSRWTLLYFAYKNLTIDSFRLFLSSKHLELSRYVDSHILFLLKFG